MNKERLLELADILDGRTFSNELGIGFNMNSYISSGGDVQHQHLKEGAHPCGTVCCIAGLAAVKYAPEYFIRGNGGRIELDQTESLDKGVSEIAEEVLDLDYETAFRLFMPFTLTHAYVDIPPEAAADVLRDLAETETVHWDDILHEHYMQYSMDEIYGHKEL